jgi:hypothetical protein
MRTWLGILGLVGACGGGGSLPADGAAIDGGGGDAVVDGTAGATIWHPAPGTSWQWQLGGAIDTTVVAQVYDVDLFETPQATIDALHAAGRKVICYFDTAYEPGRPDSGQLAPYKGNPIVGWPGQFWVDFRQPAVRAVMVARLAMAAAKRCDGVEPDDVDATANNPGFPITADDQLGFIRFLATTAHGDGLAVGLKNDLEQVPALVGDVEFAINEQCAEFAECDLLTPFIAATKPVWNAEYTDGDLAARGAQVCPAALQRNFDTIVKHLALDAPRFSCR